MDISSHETRSISVAEAAPACALNAATGVFLWPLFVAWDVRFLLSRCDTPRIVGGTFKSFEL